LTTFCDTSMQPENQISEISALQFQIESLSASFDQAIKKDLELAETKKIFRELKKVKEQLDELVEKNSGAEENK
jgi:flagellar motor switch protein FliG